MITDYIGGVCPNDYRLHGGEGSTETPKSDYVIYGWPLMAGKGFSEHDNFLWFRYGMEDQMFPKSRHCNKGGIAMPNSKYL